MRLYLSSFKIGNQPDKFVSLVGQGKRLGLIMNALDNKKESYEKWLLSQTEVFNQLGFVTEEIDLKKYFGVPDKLHQALSNIDAIWINGGNVFILRRAMHQSGFDVVIQELLKADKIVYAGFSAAVCCVAPTLKGAELVDDPNVVPEKYESEIIWDGLGLINYNVAVHYQSNHPESADTEKEIAYYQANNMPYKTLRDGEVIIIDGNQEILIS